MKIICIGDSLTYGYRISRSKVWTYISKKILNVDIINEGINGDTTGGMISRFNDAVTSQKPDIVFIMGGANDLIAGAELGIVQANIMSMAHQAFGKSIIPIVGIPPKMDLENIRDDWAKFTDFIKIDIELKKYKSWIEDFSRTFNVTYIDFYTEIEKSLIKSNNLLHLDGLHLNEDGQKIMAEIFCREISNL